MSNISVRGLGSNTIARLKLRAVREGVSVNALVLRLIDEGLGGRPARYAKRRHDDLDELAGSWTDEDAAEFEDASAAFREVDPALWK
jgi:plasmid stability protein